MKHIQNIFIIVIFIFSSFNLFAQIGKVEEINAKMSQGTNRGLKVLIPETTQKESIKAWSKLMKDYDSKNEKMKKHTEYLSSNASIPSLGEKNIDVYSQFQETPEGVYMRVFFNLGGTYLNNDMYPKKLETAKQLIASFSTRIAKASIQASLNEETKKLDKLDKELKILERDKLKFEGEIQDAKETITQREKDIDENTKNQAEKHNAIADQKAKVGKINAKLKKF
ncbi:MAG: hypothetical protein P8P81_00535 [Bacteroidia bacterium]|nr:hypothetical protein [Bacteroidia bacterium]